MESIFRPLNIYYNNTTTVNFSLNNKSFACIKHFNIKYQFIREKIFQHVIYIKQIFRTYVLANQLTKGLITTMFKDHVMNMSLSKPFDAMG